MIYTVFGTDDSELSLFCEAVVFEGEINNDCWHEYRYVVEANNPQVAIDVACKIHNWSLM